MKLHILLPLIVTLLPGQIRSQTADDWIAQGRSYLGAQDVANANASFGKALTLSPTNETANAFYAVTRILVLPNQPAGSNFLTRIGLPSAGRDIYHWTAKPPKGANRLLLAPAGVNADEFTAQMRTNLLPAIAGAISNLSAVTDTNFSLQLAGSETGGDGVTVDYGDLKLIQAGLYAAEYFTYTLKEQNLDFQLTALRALYTNGALSMGQMLADYPQLFTVATTDDLPPACAAFTNAINTYLAASGFIRARPPGEVRLFNYDPEMAKGEGDFRSVLQDLKNSLNNGPQILGLQPDVSVNMAPVFDGSMSVRGWLPKFDGNAVELGSLPDLSFDGLVDGLTQDEVESSLGKRLVMLPVGRPPEPLPGHRLSVTFSTLRNHYYVLETSTNLSDWQMQTNFTATDVSSTLIDSRSPGVTNRFYRLRDDTGFLALAGTVVDQSTGLPVVGAEIYSVFDGTSATTDAGGKFYLVTTISGSGSDWLGDELEVSAAGYGTIDDFFIGSGLVSDLIFYLAPPGDGNPGGGFGLSGLNMIMTNGDNGGASR